MLVHCILKTNYPCVLDMVLYIFYMFYIRVFYLLSYIIDFFLFEDSDEHHSGDGRIPSLNNLFIIIVFIT